MLNITNQGNAEVTQDRTSSLINALQSKANLVTNTCWQGCRGRQKNRAGGNIKMIWLLWRHYSSLL